MRLTRSDPGPGDPTYLGLGSTTFTFPNPAAACNVKSSGLGLGFTDNAARNTALIFLSGVQLTFWDPPTQFGADPPHCPCCSKPLARKGWSPPRRVLGVGGVVGCVAHPPTTACHHHPPHPNGFLTHTLKAAA